MMMQKGSVSANMLMQKHPMSIIPTSLMAGSRYSFLFQLDPKDYAGWAPRLETGWLCH